MSRYRKVEVKTWSDEKFRRLSPMPPSAQGLWLFLMTGPHTGPIPGLFRAGRAAMAEELGWDQEAFDEAFQEVFAEGMAKADFKARLMWLPNALKHNKPESPNVVRSWRVELDLLPDCDLKREAIVEIRQHLETLGAAYLNAFDEISGQGKALKKLLPKPSAKSSGKTMPNQEQEQEQEQDKEKASLSGRPDPAGDELSDQAWEAIAYLNEKHGTAYRRVEANLKFVRARLKEGASLNEVKAVVDAKMVQWGQDEKMQEYLRPATLFNATNFNQYIGQIRVNPTQIEQWWLAAGFQNRWEAENEGCTEASAWMFKGGKRVHSEHDPEAYRAARGGSSA